MKKILLYSMLLGVFGVSKAQPILNANSVTPVIGDNLVSINSSYVSPGSAGANQTWDLSGMTTGTSQNTNFINPVNTPYYSSFSNANVCFISSQGDYVYYATSSTKIQFLGMHISTGIIMNYTNPEDVMRFPFTYNNSYTDSYTGSYVYGSTTIYRRGTVQMSADGYGTITTPAGTFTNVLRFHFQETIVDSISSSSYNTSTNNSYFWYKNGNHLPIASTSEYTSTNGTTQSGNYLTNVSSGINNSSPFVSEFILSPNPAKENLNIQISLKETKYVTIKIFNAIGEEIKMVENSTLSTGFKNYQLNVSDLASGIYFAQIYINDEVAASKKFNIE